VTFSSASQPAMNNLSISSPFVSFVLSETPFVASSVYWVNNVGLLLPSLYLLLCLSVVVLLSPATYIFLVNG
jgi:hypothetical protein